MQRLYFRHNGISGLRIPVYFRALAARWSPCLLVILVLSACGGGGSGGEGGNAPAPAAPAVPFNAPALPAVVYTGRQGAAVLDDANAGAMGAAMWVGVQAALFMADSALSEGFRSSLVPPNQSLVIDTTVPGPNGGFALTTGRIAGDGTGWIAIQFDNFIDNAGNTVNGLDVTEWLQPNELRHGMHNVRITLPGRSSASFNGYVYRQASGGDTRITGELVFSSPGVEIYAGNLDLSRSSGAGYGVTGTGSAFDARFGSVDIEFQSPLFVDPANGLPHHGGPIVGLASTGQFLRLRNLTDTGLLLEYTEIGQTEPTRAVRLSWDASDFESVITSTPVSRPRANAGPSGYYLPGTEIVLDASYSQHPDHVFLGFAWELLFKPPGSTAALSDTNSLRPRLTLDRPGRYLLRLTAGDGLQVSRDYVVLTADPDTAAFVGAIDIPVGPDETVGIGDTVSVSRYVYSPQSIPWEPSASLQIDYAATGNGLDRIAQQPEQDLFMAARPGVSLLEAYTTSPSRAGARPVDQKLVGIDDVLSYAPAVWFERPGEVHAVAVMDMDGDGRDDIVTTHKNVGPVYSIELHYSVAPDSVADAVVLNGGSSSAVALGDVTGDGRPDIVRAASPGPELLAQQPDGSFASALVLDGTPCTETSDCQLKIGDIDGDGRNDVVASTGFRYVNYYLQNSDGTLATMVQVDTGVNASLALDVGDLDADGIADVAVGFAGNQANNVMALYGQAGGGLGAPVAVGPGFNAVNAPIVAVGDIDGDGKDDLVFSDSPSSGMPLLHVYLQDSSGQLLQHQAFSAESFVFGLLLHDFDRDGRMDIGMIDSASGMGVHYQDGSGQFDALRRELYGKDVKPFAAGDINADGLSDLVCYGSARRPGMAKIGIVFGADR